MPQTVTLDHRQSDPRDDLVPNVGQLAAPLAGDFARGQRRNIATPHPYGDFATGMRATNVSRVTGDFATGMRTLPRTLTLGDFATGMRTGSGPVALHRFRDSVTALPVAA